MRRSGPRARLPLALLFALALLGSGAANASAGIAVPLAHAGRWTTDAGGRVVIVHGLNMVYKRPPYAPDAIGFGEDDAAFLASEGFNTVRLGVIYKAVEPAPGVYDDAYLARIAATVQTLARHGIVSLLDFHQDLFNERFQGEGWPDWAVRDDGLPALPQAGFPANYLLMPALQHAFDHFWANDPGPGAVGLQDRYAAAWRHVAERFAGNPWVLGYDLLNEPWPGSLWQQCVNPLGCPAFDAVMSGFISRTLSAIRQVDHRTLVWYEPNVLFNNGADTNLLPTGDANTGMSFHDYCISASASGYSSACQAADGLVFANAQKRARATGDALLLSEFGATDARETLLGVLNLADRNMTSWQEWHYCGCSDPTTSGPGDQQAIVRDPSQPPQGANLKTDTLAVIARPFPQAVSGTPESYSFDPSSRVFSLTYATRRADGSGAFGAGAESEIALPARQYPGGYGVQVRGASIRSPAGAPVLRLAACAGSDRISVTVLPTGPSHGQCPASGRLTVGGRAARTRLRVSLSPRVVGAGVPATVRVTVMAASGRSLAPVSGARVTLLDARAVTDRHGRARLSVRPAASGAHTVEARARGYLPGRTTLRVVSGASSLTG